MNALATIRDAPGLDAYLEELEERLEEAVARHPGVVSTIGAEALAAGGKRLRPLLVFLATPPDEPPSVAAGVAVELVHLATLVHDDLIDGAELRRGRVAAWHAHGPDAARAVGDYLFARAFARARSSIRSEKSRPTTRAAPAARSQSAKSPVPHAASRTASPGRTTLRAPSRRAAASRAAARPCRTTRRRTAAGARAAA